MASPNKDYRENPNRAIYITGEIRQTLVDHLTPEIFRLRNESTDPITVYIDSVGGDVQPAEIIRKLVKSPNQDGHRIRLITVATGTAASAAADLLTLGDYAIAYPHAQIIYHGTRRAVPSGLTVEAASSIAESLQQTNEMFAARLATKAFDRFVIRLMLFKPEFQNYAAEAHGSPNIEPLIERLSKELSLDAARLANQAALRQRDIKKLSTAVSRHMQRFKRQLKPPAFEMEVFKGILRHSAREFAKKDRLLSQGGLSDVAAGFQILWDFHFGDHQQLVNRWVKTYGRNFLSAVEMGEYEAKLASKDKDAEAWLSDRANQKIRFIWYFTVSLCRMLQTADFRLTPVDAYWLSLVNEVTGQTGLPNERVLIEASAP